VGAQLRDKFMVKRNDGLLVVLSRGSTDINKGLFTVKVEVGTLQFGQFTPAQN
jgi:hypothetical protein